VRPDRRSDRPARASDEPQVAEDWVGGSGIGLPADPILHRRQTKRGLMNVVTIGDIGEGAKDPLEAVNFAGDRGFGASLAQATKRVFQPIVQHVPP